jgi:hypothetical protein
VIWNPQNAEHFNKIKKQDAWEEIGQELNRSVEEEPLHTSTRKERKVCDEEQRLDTAFKILTASTNEKNDECQHFGNLVACKLRVLWPSKTLGFVLKIIRATVRPVDAKLENS